MSNKLTEEIKEILKSNVCYFATSSKDGVPNVVPVGFVEPQSDTEILLADVQFEKTRKNLDENPQVALAIYDNEKTLSFQIKGKVTLFSSGEYFEKVNEIFSNMKQKRKKILEKAIDETEDENEKEKYKEQMKKFDKLEPRAAVLLTVTNIYPTI